MNNSRPVYILLGTYNGAQYIADQINSIQRQKIQNWKMLIRDDCSSDKTVDIVDKIALQDDRISLIKDQKGHLGVVGNFATLMHAALNDNAQIIFFSDQDDIWLPHKIDYYLYHLKKLQKQFGNFLPILIHSDLIVVDNQINVINKSFMALRNIYHEFKKPLNTLLTQNFVTGCTIAVNRSLLQLALPIPKEVLIHDWWLALCAASSGKIEFIQSPTVLYRQHDRNTVGAKKFWHFTNPFNASPNNNWKSAVALIKKSIYQAKALKVRIKDHAIKFNEDALRLIKVYTNIFKINKIRRIKLIVRNNLRRQGFIRQTIFFIIIITAKREKDK